MSMNIFEEAIASYERLREAGVSSDVIDAAIARERVRSDVARLMNEENN